MGDIVVFYLFYEQKGAYFFNYHGFKSVLMLCQCQNNFTESWKLQNVNYDCLKSKRLCSYLSSSSFLHHFSGIMGNSEQKNISQTIEQLMQFIYLLLLKEIFSGLFFFWTSRSEREFPRDYLISVATSFHTRILHNIRIGIKQWAKTCLNLSKSWY